MSVPEVDWVLDQFGTVVSSVAADYSQADGQDVAVYRVDREEDEIYGGEGTFDMSTAISSHKSKLRSGVYAGATLADRVTEPQGTGYDHRVEVIVGVLIEGLSIDKMGHVDPSGEGGVPFDELVRRCRSAITDQRNYPNVNSPDARYHTALIDSEDPQSADFSDFYRHSFDVRLVGEQDL